MSHVNNGISFDGNASKLAFRVGQDVEQLLLEKAEKAVIARHPNHEHVLITEEDIRGVFDSSVVEDVRIRLGIIDVLAPHQRRRA